MEPEYITKKELKSQTHELLKTATLAQYKWMYAYLKDLEEWPIVVDELKAPKEQKPIGDPVLDLDYTKCPYD
tara:strand:- start:484 stop:699 length:216 start_codon:yes stop_codon:yes gene_type:complete